MPRPARAPWAYLSLFLWVFAVLPDSAEAQRGSRGRVIHRGHQAVLRGGVHVLDEGTLARLQWSSDDGSVLIFERSTRQLRRIMGGDVVVCGVSALTPDGLLKRVSEISSGRGGRVILRAVPAKLEDVFWNTRAHGRVSVLAADVDRFEARAPGARVRLRSGPAEGEAMSQPKASLASELAWSPPPIEIDLVHVVVFDLDQDPATTDDQVRLDGMVGVAPSFEIELDIDWGRVKRFSFLDRNKLFSRLELTADVFVPVLDKSVTVASIRFAPVVIMAGPVPLVFTPVLDVNVGASGSVTATFRSSLEAEMTVALGAIYENREWRGILDLPDGIEDIEVTWEKPELFVEAEARAYAGPRFSFLLYGVVGPFANLEGFTELSAALLPDPGWRLYLGVRAGVGVEASLPMGIPVYTFPVLDRKWMVAEGNFNPF